MNTFNSAGALTSVFALALLSACGDKATEAPVNESNAETAVSVYVAALHNSLRPEDDKSRDANRKPAEVLEFIGIKPGMTVLDMFSGGGWYSEIIAHVVGPHGKVYAHSNEAYKNFVGDALEDRFADNRISRSKF